MSMSSPYDIDIIAHAPLPELPAAAATTWLQRRRQIRAIVEKYLYGSLPPTPATTHAELLDSCPYTKVEGVVMQHYRIITTAINYSFEVKLWLPPSDKPLPLIIDGDACWNFIEKKRAALFIMRGYAFAYFNRCAIAPDMPDSRHCGIYQQYPNAPFGALAAWAWGYHRVIDAFVNHPRIDPKKIIVSGHAQGGKAALLAGATDTRVAITNPNASGCMGGGCLRQLHPEAETLEDITTDNPHWFAPTLKPGTSPLAIPIDLHFVKALVAPRALICTESFNDSRNNPPGVSFTHQAALPIWKLFSAEHVLTINYRNGPHGHEPSDWAALLRFADNCFKEGPKPAQE